MDFNLSIYFAASKTPDYNTVIEYATLFEGFSPAGSGTKLNVIQTTNHEILAKYDAFQQLMRAIGGMKSAGITFRGIETDPLSFSRNTRDIVECYLGHQNAENKAEYCSADPHCWGCRQLKGIILRQDLVPYNENARYWYQYGAFVNKKTWRINKEELTQALTEIVENKSIDFCPAFQFAFFRRLVAELPATLDLTDTKNWGEIYAEEIVSDMRKWQPVNVYYKSTVTAAPAKDAVKAASAAQATRDRISENRHLRNIPETSFDDIGGIEDIIQNIREVIELPIKRPEIYDHLGIRPYRGILLWGEPGNGKTLIAKAIAHEVNAHFIPIAGPDILNKSFGESEKNLRDIFFEAMELQPSVIFIDEIDSIAQDRLAGEASKWYATVVNQLLALMDGVKEFGNVTVLASTNRPDLLDPALLRPGRFDYKLEVRRPNLYGCKKILEIATRDMPLDKDVDLFAFAEIVLGYSAAEITFIAREAALVALRRSVDVKSVIKEDETEKDYSHIIVKRADFLSALVTLKKYYKYTNKTYTLK
jgi:transitional endoplasmic reticulum ATPase